MTTNRYSITKTQPSFEKSLRVLSPDVRIAISQIEPILEINPHQIAKPLRAPLEGKYAIRILGRRYRLVCRIQDQTHRVFLDYVMPRSTSYAS